MIDSPLSERIIGCFTTIDKTSIKISRGENNLIFLDISRPTQSINMNHNDTEKLISLLTLALKGENNGHPTIG